MRVIGVCSKKQSLLLLFGITADFQMLVSSMENNSWNPRCQYKLWNSSADLQIPWKVNLEHKLNNLVIQFLHTELVTHLRWSMAFRWLFPSMQGFKIKSKQTGKKPLKPAQNEFWSFNFETRMQVVPKRTKINRGWIWEWNTDICMFRH